MFSIVESVATTLTHFLNAHPMEAVIAAGVFVGVSIYFCIDLPSETLGSESEQG